MRAAFLPPLVLAGFLLAGAAAGAQVEPVITYKYYPVTPELGRSLQQQLLSDTPLLLSEGQKALGTATSHLRYKHGVKSTPTIGRCQVRNLEVTLECEVALPKLMSDDPDLNSDFNAYLALLKDHELTHCRISATHANRFQKTVLALGDRPCPGLKSEIEALYQQMTAELNRDQDLFDQETRASRYPTWGAYLLNRPPPAQVLSGARGGLSNLPEPGQDNFWAGPTAGDRETGAIYKDKDGVWRNY